MEEEEGCQRIQEELKIELKDKKIKNIIKKGMNSIKRINSSRDINLNHLKRIKMHKNKIPKLINKKN